MSKDSKKVEFVHPQYSEMTGKHGEENVKEVVLSDKKGNSLTVLIKTPDLKATSDFIVWNDKDFQRCLTLLNNRCLLTNKEEVSANKEFFFACGSAIASLIEVGSFEIKNA